MKIDEKTAKLICEIEYIIGDQCYNPSSYDGWTGEEGREFRYPVNVYPNKEASKAVKIRGNVCNDFMYNNYYHGEFNESNIRSMKYKFGSNHLFIGTGIIKALDLLEKRYNLDFSELEKRYQEEQG